jgi:DHA1 family inner membrane transport protein
VGSTLGGKLADWRLMPSLVAFLLAIIVILTIFAGTMHSEIPAMITIFVWGILAFAIVPPLQMLIVDRASHAPNLASTLNQGAFNLGNATGAWLGGMAIGAGAPLTTLPWVGVATSIGALVLNAWRWRANRPSARSRQTLHRCG